MTDDRIEIVDTSLFDEEELHYPCYVQVLRNSVTGETSVGWWEEEPTRVDEDELNDIIAEVKGWDTPND